jgi:hypothetical protein
VAQTFSRSMHEKELLGASFFCSRASSDLSNAQIIIPTIAFQLCFFSPDFRLGVLEAIQENHQIGYSNLNHQIEKLFVNPLRKVSPARHPVVIVLDSLDECHNNSLTSTLIELLSLHLRSYPFLKIFITSRPESHIRAIFRKEKLKLETKVMVLHDIEKCVTEGDIRVFLLSQLSEVASNRSDMSLTCPWPPLEAVETLVRKCGALFIYAFTACTFIASEHHDPKSQLDILINDQTGKVDPGIDKLYMDIFSLAFRASSDSKVLTHLRHILAAVVLLFDRIPLLAMARLLGCKAIDIRRSLKLLHSVVVIPDDDEAIVRTFHSSFHDFLVDDQRCTDPRFHIRPSTHHAQLALNCLKCMQKHLKRNICELEDGQMNSHVPDLDSRRTKYIGGDLKYSCRHWANHVAQVTHTGAEVGPIVKALRLFVFTHLLHWIEVLSLSGDLGAALDLLKTAQSWYPVCLSYQPLME